jgi:hypothetical protein
MLKTIAGLQGVNILSKDAQKKVSGGVAATNCGVVLFNSAGNASSFWWSSDANGNGRTKDDAIGEMNAYNAANPGGYYTAHWCCASCGNYA